MGNYRGLEIVITEAWSSCGHLQELSCDALVSGAPGRGKGKREMFFSMCGNFRVKKMVSQFLGK